MRTAHWLLVAVCAAGWCTQAAVAQPDQTPTVRVAVYDFTEPDDYEGHLVGRRAAEGTQVALAAAGLWDLVERPVLLHECAAENLTAPFGVGYLQMLGRKLNASLAVTGLVQTCAVNPDRGTAQVTLKCELIEAIGGEGLGWFSGVGSAKRGDGEAATVEEIVDRALIEAAGNVAASLMSMNQWATSVMARMDNGQLMMQPVAEPRIAAGEKAIVCRLAPDGWRLIAVIEVQRADDTSVRARVVSQLSDPQTNDVAVAVAR